MIDGTRAAHPPPLGFGVAGPRLQRALDEAQKACDLPVSKCDLPLSLPAAIRVVRSIFRKELDKLMSAFKKPSPDFYNGYFTPRIIVDRRDDPAEKTGTTADTVTAP